MKNQRIVLTTEIRLVNQIKLRRDTIQQELQALGDDFSN